MDLLCVVKKNLRRCTLFRFLYREYLYYKNKRLYKKNPFAPADALYFRAFKKHINWNNPRDLNEKINWLLHYSDLSLWTECADKYKVRDYVKKSVGENYLVKLYGKWDNSVDIDFDQLPQKFVLKTNNGCGTVKIVTDKSTLNKTRIIKELNQWMKHPYGYVGGQIHYLSINPCIIAEELLEESENMKKLSPTSLVDYKIWCINGEPECVLVIFGRENRTYYRQVYDLNWNKMPEVMNMHTNGHFLYKDVDIPKPICLNEMLDISRKLSKPFLEVRVDLYVIGEKPYFGELTFTSGMGSFTEDYYRYLGDKIDLNNIVGGRNGI